MPAVCGVLMSSSPAWTTRTPSRRHRDWVASGIVALPNRQARERCRLRASLAGKRSTEQRSQAALDRDEPCRLASRPAGAYFTTVTDASAQQLVAPTRLTARALIVGDRIDTAGLERPDTISLLPLAFRIGETGMVALFRFGVAVMVGLSPLEEEDTLAKLQSRVYGERARGDDEYAVLEIAPESDEQKSSGGPIQIKNLSPQRFLVVADALAKTVALARDEREVNKVFDVIEPFAARLAVSGRTPFRRRAMLRLIGQALLVQHRVSGRVAVEEKPDVLWDRPDLERLYARLEDEYELKERAGVLKRKLDVIVETAHALTDIIDADRATRLEWAIILLIVAELIAAVVQIWIAMAGRVGHG